VIKVQLEALSTDPAQVDTDIKVLLMGIMILVLIYPHTLDQIEMIFKKRVLVEKLDIDPVPVVLDISVLVKKAII